MLLSIFGDSIMAGVVQEDGRYSRCRDQFQRLETETDVRLDNHSSFGSTVVKGFERMNKFLRQGALGEYTLVEFGGNDCAYDWAEVAAAPDEGHLSVVPPEVFEKQYEQMLLAVEAAGSKPVAATLPPISSTGWGIWRPFPAGRRATAPLCPGWLKSWAAVCWTCALPFPPPGRSWSSISARTASTPTAWASS